MPYKRNADLPAPVRNHLPAKAQEIYRKAYNNAFKTYEQDEARSARVAWAAVKKLYKKSGSTWKHKKTAVKKSTKNTAKSGTKKSASKKSAPKRTKKSSTKRVTTKRRARK